MAPPFGDKDFATEWGELRGDVRALRRLAEEFATWRHEHDAADARTHGDHGARLAHLERGAERVEDRAETTGAHQLVEAKTSARWSTTTIVSVVFGLVGFVIGIASLVKGH